MNISISDKLDILIYLASFSILLSVIGSIFRAYKQQSVGILSLEAIENLLAKGKYKQAFAACKTYQKERPHDPAGLWITAVTLFRAGKKQEAKLVFEQLIIKEPLFKEKAGKYLESINI